MYLRERELFEKELFLKKRIYFLSKFKFIQILLTFLALAKPVSFKV